MVCHAYNSYCDFNECRCREEQMNKCYVIYSVVSWFHLGASPASSSLDEVYVLECTLRSYMYLYDLSKIAAMCIMHVYYILEGVGWGGVGSSPS